MSWEDITKEEFDLAYMMYQPSGWIKFAYRYFSKQTVEEDMKPRKFVVGILLGLFGVGFLATVLGLPREVIAPVTIGYSILLAVLVLYLFSAVFANNHRINKIRKILGVTKWEYNKLADKYM